MKTYTAAEIGRGPKRKAKGASRKAKGASRKAFKGSLHVGAAVEFRGVEGTYYGTVERFEGGYAMVRWSDGGVLTGVTPEKLRLIPPGYQGPSRVHQSGHRPGGFVSSAEARGSGGAKSYGQLYVAAIAADSAWSAELERLFGVEAGDVRYTQRGKGEPGSELRRLHDAKLAADREQRGEENLPLRLHEVKIREAEDLAKRAASGGPEILSSAEVVRLPIGSIVFLWKEGRPHGTTLVVVPDGKLTQAALLPERAGGEEPGGEPVAVWGREFALISRGRGQLPTHGTAQRKAVAWYERLAGR